MATDPVGWGENNDDLGGNSDNPYVAYSKVKAILNCANDPSTCDGDDSTDRVRAANRRVEFKIVSDVEGTIQDQDSGPTDDTIDR